MQVFKAFFKVIKGNLGQILIYVAVLLGVSLLITTVELPEKGATEFSANQCPVAVLSQDADTPLIRGMREYLGKQNQLVELENETEAIQDALFFHRVEYVAILPDGFTQDFFAGTEPTVQAMTVPGSTNAYYLDMLVERYLNTARLYLQAEPGLSQEEVALRVAEDLDVDTQVELKEFGTGGVEVDYVFFFRYLPYAILGMMILGIGSIMMAFQKTDLNRRNLCSPLSLRSRNLQLALGGGVFALACWGLMMIFGLLLYGDGLLRSGLLELFLLNSLCFTVVGTAVAFLAGVFLRSYSMMSAMSNVLSLGLCFLSGVFVPQQLMSKEVLRVASFTPTYWYVKANEAISALSVKDWAHLSPVFANMLVQLGFAVALFAVALLVSKQKRTSNG